MVHLVPTRQELFGTDLTTKYSFYFQQQKSVIQHLPNKTSLFIYLVLERIISCLLFVVLGQDSRTQGLSASTNT